MPESDPQRAAREEARRVAKESARPAIAAASEAEAARIAALPPEPVPDAAEVL